MYDVMENGLQVRFEKFTPKPGYLLAHCADQVSADWLSDIVPRLGPEQGSLKALSGNEIPKTMACTAYIPNEFVEELMAEPVVGRREKVNQA